MTTFAGFTHEQENIVDISKYLTATYIYDIEIYPNYFLAVFYNINTHQHTSYHLTGELLKDIILNPAVTLIGWNNHYYDDLILKCIANENKNKTDIITTPKTLYELSKEIIESDITTPRVKTLRYYRDNRLFRSIDLKGLMDPMPSLKKVEIRMQYPNVQDLPFNPYIPLKKEQTKIVKDYCHNDVNATFHFYKNHALPHIQLREYLMERFNIVEDLRSYSEARTAEFILHNQYALRTTREDDIPISAYNLRQSLKTPEPVAVKECVPNWIHFQTKRMQETLEKIKSLILPINPTGYVNGNLLKKIVQIGNKNYQMGIGGLHSIDEPAVYRTNPLSPDIQLIDADVTSYYPSLVLRDNLYPRGYNSQWNEIYNNIYKERLEAKEDNTRKTEAYALKIILNATFGKFGSQYSPFYDPKLMVQITLTGQLGLLMLIEQCNLHDIEVLSANTDGIMVRVQNNEEKEWFNNLCNQWMNHTRLNLEYTYYRCIARRDVNNYTALTLDNKIKNKGFFVPPDIKHDVKAPIVQDMARAYLLYNIHPKDYFKENKNELNIYSFLYSFSATNAFNVSIGRLETPEYKPLSKSNRWYINNRNLNQKLFKHGGKRNNTISIPDSNNPTIANNIKNEDIPSDLNINHYINQAIKFIVTCGISTEDLNNV